MCNNQYYYDLPREEAAFLWLLIAAFPHFSLHDSRLSLGSWLSFTKHPRESEWWNINFFSQVWMEAHAYVYYVKVESVRTQKSVGIWRQLLSADVCLQAVGSDEWWLRQNRRSLFCQCLLVWFFKIFSGQFENGTRNNQLYCADDLDHHPDLEILF